VVIAVLFPPFDVTAPRGTSSSLFGGFHFVGNTKTVTEIGWFRTVNGTMLFAELFGLVFVTIVLFLALKSGSANGGKSNV